MVNVIANIYNSSTNTWQAVASTISYGNVTSGTGNIVTFTGNNTVIGYGTVFLTQLGNNYSIKNSANVYVGKISNILSNTSATLTTNAAVAISSNVSPTNFNYQTYTITPINFDTTTWKFTDNPSLGNGNITVSNANSVVVGTNTAFNMQLKVGSQIFANIATSNLPVLVGIVKTVISNTSATLTTNAVANLTSTSYSYYDVITKNTSNVFPTNGHKLHSAMLEWSQSGLIAGVKQVKSYHPPVQDPITGILVNFPSTMHTTTANVDALLAGNAHPIHKLPNFNFAPSAQTTEQNVKVDDFDSENGFVGSSIKNAIDSIPLNNVFRKLVSSTVSDDQFAETIPQIVSKVYGKGYTTPPPGTIVDSPPPGFNLVDSLSMIDKPYIAYQGPGANIVYVINQNVISNAYPTSADQFALAVGFNPLTRITATRSDANSYYSITNPIDTLTDAQRADLAARASSQFTTDSYKRVANTGVPAAIPGLLNFALADENPGNRTFDVPSYNKPRVPTTPKVSYNPDLPKSPTNTTQYEYKINE